VRKGEREKQRFKVLLHLCVRIGNSIAAFQALAWRGPLQMIRTQLCKMAFWTKNF